MTTRFLVSTTRMPPPFYQNRTPFLQHWLKSNQRSSEPKPSTSFLIYLPAEHTQQGPRQGKTLPLTPPKKKSLKQNSKGHNENSSLGASKTLSNADLFTGYFLKLKKTKQALRLDRTQLQSRPVPWFAPWLWAMAFWPLQTLSFFICKGQNHHYLPRTPLKAD